MILSDDQIRAAYSQCGSSSPLLPHHMKQAKRFIEAVFNQLTPVGYDDDDFQPTYKRPEFQCSVS